MSDKPSANARPGGFAIGRLAGIEIRLDLSLILIFGLVAFSLGSGLFPSWHPDWSALLTWGTAFAAAALFFVSLLVHELAHSLVALRHGIPVPRITLFLFGGVSEMGQEPDSPGAEFRIAIVGPAASIVLGVVFTWLALSLAGDDFGQRMADDPAAALAGLGPLATLLLWLGPVNLMLGIFNLVPGFPLDGGRVLRAALWQFGGDLEAATRRAAAVGRLCAWFLMALGVFQALGGAVLQGLWLVLIGWFLNNAARSSYTQLLLRHALEKMRVADLMRTHFETVSPDMALDRFVDECLLRSGQTAWPVVAGDNLEGLIDFDDVRAVPEAERGSRRVADAMKPLDDLTTVDSELSGQRTLSAIVEAGGDPTLVVRDGAVVGLLHQGDIFRWLAMHHLNPPQV